MEVRHGKLYLFGSVICLFYASPMQAQNDLLHNYTVTGVIYKGISLVVQNAGIFSVNILSMLGQSIVCGLVVKLKNFGR